jgi:hypothetical protein
VPVTSVWKSAIVAAVACCLSACGAATTANTAATTTTRSSQPAAAGQSAPSRATPGGALAGFIHQVAVGDRRAACADASPVPSQVAECMSAKGTPLFTGLHKSFSGVGIRTATPILVTAGHVTGANATISASDVEVNGTSLLNLIVEHSTGVKPGQVSMLWMLDRVDGAWYVNNMSLNF